MNGHPDVDALADLAEGGLLPPAEEAAVRAHLAVCAECADTVAALSDVPALLAQAAVPEPMPAAVAAALDRALAAAARDQGGPAGDDDTAGRAELPSPAPPTGRDGPAAPVRPSAAPGAIPPPRPAFAPVVPMERARGRRSRRPALVLAAAAVAAVLLGAGLLVSGRDGGDRQTADGGARVAAPDTARGGAPAEAAPFAPVQGPPSAYTTAGLPAQIRELLRRRGDETNPSPPGPGSGPLTGDEAPPCVRQALTRLDVTYGTAVAVDFGTFDGRLAHVLVWATGSPRTMRVVAVSVACPYPAGAQVLADTTVVV